MVWSPFSRACAEIGGGSTLTPRARRVKRRVRPSATTRCANIIREAWTMVTTARIGCVLLCAVALVLCGCGAKETSPAGKSAGTSPAANAGAQAAAGNLGQTGDHETRMEQREMRGAERSAAQQEAAGAAEGAAKPTEGTAAPAPAEPAPSAPPATPDTSAAPPTSAEPSPAPPAADAPAERLKDKKKAD